MKISNDKIKDLMMVYVRKTEVQPPKADAHEAKRQEALKDRVQISARNEMVSNLVARAKEAPEIRKDKVQSIKEAIKTGEYRIDGRQVARNILREDILNEIV